MASDFQKMSMAEGEVTRGEHRFERPRQLILIPLDTSTLPSWHSIFIPSVQFVYDGRSVHEIGVAVCIMGVTTLER